MRSKGDGNKSPAVMGVNHSVRALAMIIDSPVSAKKTITKLMSIYPGGFGIRKLAGRRI